MYAQTWTVNPWTEYAQEKYRVSIDLARAFIIMVQEGMGQGSLKAYDRKFTATHLFLGLESL